LSARPKSDDDFTESGSASHTSQARHEVKQFDIGPAVPPANGR